MDAQQGESLANATAQAVRKYWCMCLVYKSVSGRTRRILLLVHRAYSVPDKKYLFLSRLTPVASTER